GVHPQAVGAFLSRYIHAPRIQHGSAVRQNHEFRLRRVPFAQARRAGNIGVASRVASASLSFFELPSSTRLKTRPVSATRPLLGWTRARKPELSMGTPFTRCSNTVTSCGREARSR